MSCLNEVRALAGLAAAWLLPAAFAAEPAASVTVYAAGDIARCDEGDPARSGAAATADLIVSGLVADPQAAVLMLGDATYPVGAPAEFTDCYAPTWGRFKSRTWPTPGNHEYATKGAAGYFGYFGAAAGRGYYSFQLGHWRLYSLNSNLGKTEHAVQMAWLRGELARHGERCTLAYWHHPLYSSGMHGSFARMKDAWQALYEAGAELVLAGHDHTYERFAPQDAEGRRKDASGIRQFVVGTGGAFATPLKWPLPNSQASDANRYGVLKLVLSADSYAWEFLDAAADGARLDHGTARCH